MHRSYDVVVVGSGPNGLGAAIVAARCGLSTLLVEASGTVGGGVRSAELTLPGFTNDVCSAVHPMAQASPLFRALPLKEFGLEWVTPPAAAAHPLGGSDAMVLPNNLDDAIHMLDADGKRYMRTIGALAHRWPRIESDVLGPLGIPKHPIDFTLFGVQALMPADLYAKLAYSSDRTRALFAGCAAHSILPLSHPSSAAIGLVLAAVAHIYGWPVPKRGSQSIADALCRYYLTLGGEVATSFNVERIEQLPQARVYLFDTSPRTLARVMRDRLPVGFAETLEGYKYGPGVFKVDWALSEPIPWSARQCMTAATVHVGGSLSEISESELAPWKGKTSERPFVMVTQPSLFDDTRAPAGKHTAWGYCHVPNGSDEDMTTRLEAQIERFAPGFRDVILNRAVRPPSVLAHDNANLVGGDVGGGSNQLLNLFMRPTWRTYSTPAKGVYLCSAATPPGGGVHGMCGYRAAVRAIGKEFGEETLNRSGLIGL